MKYKEYMTTDRPFNFAELLLQRLDNLFQEANRVAVEGDAATWYRVLGALKRSISFVTHKTIKKTEEDEIELITTRLRKLKGKIRQADQTKSEVLYYEIEKDLEEIETEIVKILYENELYYPHYSRKPWEQVAEEEPT